MYNDFSVIGFGEAAQTFCRQGEWSAHAQVFDRKTDDPALADHKRCEFSALGVNGYADTKSAVKSSDLILSLVTADQSVNAAKAASEALGSHALFLDMNSVAPDTKREAAKIVDAKGGRYVDVAIMAPVQPKALDVPILISGPAAGDAHNALAGLGFKNLKIAGADVGQASTIKMLRSIMIKGIEALTAECVLAADRAGALDAVLEALGGDWAERANYNLDRMMIHGTRRAAEMEEVVRTIEGLGMQALLTSGTVRRQAEIGALGHKKTPENLKEKLALLAQEETIS
ncbi:NAD(P)-dependent oxidoreductase [Ponticaulis sp.]|uniref:NAD(P)-dependent oxidoreductase n=1 Tax=Ponticaulis sp. TaxID=2020902 RepID=UPI000B6773D8|nr:NAD(P)-dependent oxidoreductase [Ponticaulis sp.]MAJ09767.1 6-phosphogluconate dehydrogenase [Ponticaulis sp.]RPG17104.1 MAG: NAD(P)-dependent oxidoreductase [Hyphomonadaceae bacterium TMED125]|tara:strand:- start:9454 stop:10314 length:861 start_codon:yes stop_codon:yes gene_type:complete